jgi:hypothetical protein
MRARCRGSVNPFQTEAKPPDPGLANSIQIMGHTQQRKNTPHAADKINGRSIARSKDSYSPRIF